MTQPLGPVSDIQMDAMVHCMQHLHQHTVAFDLIALRASEQAALRYLEQDRLLLGHSQAEAKELRAEVERLKKDFALANGVAHRLAEGEARLRAELMRLKSHLDEWCNRYENPFTGSDDAIYHAQLYEAYTELRGQLQEALNGR